MRGVSVDELGEGEGIERVLGVLGCFWDVRFWRAGGEWGGRDGKGRNRCISWSPLLRVSSSCRMGDGTWGKVLGFWGKGGIWCF